MAVLKTGLLTPNLLLLVHGTSSWLEALAVLGRAPSGDSREDFLV